MTEAIERLRKSNFAAYAVARLYSGNLTAEEQLEIEEWLAQDKVNREEYETLLGLWDRCGELSKDLEIAESVLGPRDTRPTVQQYSINRFLSWTAAIAAAIAIVSLSILWNPFAKQEAMHEIFETAIGDQLEVDLVDGSFITLNTDTELLVDFGPNKRHIVMKRGEAYFDIRKDPARPLVVLAGEQVLTVLGTKFNVRWFGADVTVAVLDGSVAVRSESKALSRTPDDTVRPPDKSPDTEVDQSAEVLLETGSIGVFSPAANPVVDRAQPKVADIPSWRFGLVRFENAPLYQVIGEINRYTETKIVIEDKSIMELKLSGAFRPTEVEAVLDGLQETLPIRVIAEFQRYVIVGNPDTQNI